MFSLPDQHLKWRTKSKLSKSSTTSSSISTAGIQCIIEKLKYEHINDTRKNYYSVWESFNNFFVQLDEKPDNWEDRITLFVGYLINDRQAKSQAVKSYVSTMKAVLMDIDVEVNEDRVLLAALTKACKFRNDFVRT